MENSGTLNPEQIINYDFKRQEKYWVILKSFLDRNNLKLEKMDYTIFDTHRSGYKTGRQVIGFKLYATNVVWNKYESGNEAAGHNNIKIAGTTLKMTEFSFLSKETQDSILKGVYFSRGCVNSDGSIDVNSDVTLKNKKLTKMPVTFNEVTGDFSIAKNELTSLQGCPNNVGGYFEISHNPLVNLDYLPKTIGGQLYCNVYDSIKDPFEYRKILFSNIEEQIVLGLEKESIIIQDILNKYKGKPEYFHIAIEQLMDLGEKLGFKYD